MATKLQVRHDSTENWLSTNPVLEMAEPGYETTTNRLKLGDGLTAWKDLPYLKGETYDDTNIKQEISEINTKLETKANSVDVYTKTEIENLKYIDEDELASKNYMSKDEALDEFNTKTEITEMLENYVPVTRTINAKTLNANIVLTASDVNALPASTKVPTKTSELDNDMGFLSAVPAEYVTETELKARGYATTNDVNDMLAAKADKDSLAEVATSGSYNDLTDKPAIPSEYTLPIASSSVLGGIKVGSGLAVSEDGTLSSTTSGGTTDYTALSNKPQINGIELSGNKTLDQLNIQVKGDYVTTSSLNESLNLKQDKSDMSNYVTTTSLSSELSTKADKTELTNYLTKTDASSTYATKSTTLAGYGIADAYTKTEVDSMVSAVFKYKGSVANEAALPEDASEGDVYNVEDTGANYVWNGSSWDKLSETVDLTSYLTKSEASTTYATKEELKLKADSSSIPTKVSELQNDSNFITNTQLTTKLGEYVTLTELAESDYVTNANLTTKLDDYVISSVLNSSLSTKADKIELGNYTTTADLNDLLADKADTSALANYATTESLNNYVLTTTMTSELAKKANTSTTISGYGITDAYTKSEVNTELAKKANTSSLSTVATSGSYNDLTNKPTIPEAYTLPTASTLELGGVKIDGTTITIQDGVISAVQGSTGSTSYADLTNKPQINSVELSGNKTLAELGIQAAGNYATTTALSDGLATKADTSALPASTSLMVGTAPTVEDISSESVTEISALITALNAILAQLRTRGVIA